MREYLSYGESGMEDLKEAVHERRRKPVIQAFCQELRRVLGSEAPVPTELINHEFRRRAQQDGSELTQYDDQEAYEALADLWDFLEIDNEGKPLPPKGSLREAAIQRRSQMLWVEGDPLVALKTWISWPSLALFASGVVVCIGSYTAYEAVSVGFVRILLLTLAIIGFVASAVGGGTLWLRRVRYVNPHAFLPREKPDEGRR